MFIRGTGRKSLSVVIKGDVVDEIVVARIKLCKLHLLAGQLWFPTVATTPVERMEKVVRRDKTEIFVDHRYYPLLSLLSHLNEDNYTPVGSKWKPIPQFSELPTPGIAKWIHNSAIASRFLAYLMVPTYTGWNPTA
jgi:hypothetical protein